jgi:site-specific DNA-adenine methylase
MLYRSTDRRCRTGAPVKYLAHNASFHSLEKYAPRNAGTKQLILSDARKGDVVYLDPPYTVAHGNNGFVKYNAKIFSWEDQQRLAQTAHDLNRRGCTVIISNADHESIRKLYTSFRVLTVERHSVMAASDGFRRKITECIFYNGSPKHAS